MLNYSFFPLQASSFPLHSWWIPNLCAGTWENSRMCHFSVVCQISLVVFVQVIWLLLLLRYWIILILENKSDNKVGHFESVGLRTPSRLRTPWQTYWHITQFLVFFFFLWIRSCVERSLWIKAVNSKQTETVCSVSLSSILYVSLSAVMHNGVVFGRQTCSTESMWRENVGLYTLHLDS